MRAEITLLFHLVHNIRQTSRPVPTRLPAPLHNQSSRARDTIAKASQMSTPFPPRCSTLPSLPKARWRRIESEQL